MGADGFIRALPEGYDQQVGKRGGRISAGQRQVISFARAFLAAPAVLVLDEATSLLDIPSERLVQQALQTILTGRTAVIIAHRLSTVEIADRVLVIDGDRSWRTGRRASLRPGWLPGRRTGRARCHRGLGLASRRRRPFWPARAPRCNGSQTSGGRRWPGRLRRED